MKISKYYPFKSTETEEKYLRLYNKTAALQSILSELRIVNYSHDQKVLQIKRRINNE